MPPMPSGEVTSLLRASREGHLDALDRLLTLLYPNLRHMAAGLLDRESHAFTLQPTSLLHEALLRLFFQGRPPEAKDRAHLMAIAGRQMRCVLIDHARARLRQCRGSGAQAVAEDGAGTTLPDPRDLEALLMLEDLLEELAQADPRAAEVFELSFFAGLQREEVAQRLGVHVRTVQRDWDFARAWLQEALLGEAV